MIFQAKTRAPAEPASSTARPILQRKCACGAKCKCEDGGGKLTINQPDDRFEREADRMAERVMSGGSVGKISATPNEFVQRDDDEKKAPPKPNNYGDAAKKIGDAFQETAIGKQLKAKAEELGKDFLSSVEGKVIAGSSLAGALTALIATNSELPIPIPEIPLDFIKPGLKAKLTYEGPTQKPTNVGLTLTSQSGVSLSASYTKTAATPGKPAEEKGGLTLSFPLGGSSSKKKTTSDSDKRAAEIAQLRAEKAKRDEERKTPAEKQADEEFLKSYLHFKANDPLNPLNIGKKKDDLLLMRSATAENGHSVAPPIVHDVLAGSGQPLDLRTRSFMEERFGYDFSAVRIHTDAKAAESARAVSANAYTVGSQIAFNSARYSPGSVAGHRLLAHELAHVVQQSGAAPSVQRETYYGGGYKQRPYGSIDAEIAAGQKKPSEWHPATDDMAATAAGSGGGEAVSTLDELLKKIEAKGKGSITRLNLIGHSNSRVFSFAGKITADNVEFSPDAALYADAISDKASRFAALRDRFAPGAKIVLYSCDAGTGQSLLDAVGDGFGVCVEGFTSEIWWCLTKKSGKAVRGHIWAQNPNDPLPPEHPPDCETLSSDIATLTTGGKSKQCAAANSAAGGTVQRKTANGSNRGAGVAETESAPGIVHDVLAENGQALETRSRAFMERRFGHDFSRVRVHTGAKASASARAVNAQAYTVGAHVVFEDQRLDSPRALDSAQDRSLLAHELSHVIQQQNAPAASLLRIAPAADGAEMEAERAAQTALRSSEGPRLPRLAQLQRARLQRQVLDFRSGNQLGAITKPGLDDNTKRELEIVLRWMLELWAIEILVFNKTIISWAKYGPDDQISGSDLQPFIDAVKKSEKANLANEVSNNLLGLSLPGGRGVGDGSQSEPADLAAVQDALKRHGFLTSTAMADTLVAIKKFKRSVAEGRFGLDPMRPNERVNERDKFAARTFFAKGDAIPDVIIAALQQPKKPPVKKTLTKALPIFVPQGAPSDRNKVHLFFTPFLAYAPGGAGGFLAQQGLRAESDASGWLLIGVPALDEPDQPNFVTISTSEIQDCLAVAGRQRTGIDALRLTAHSRGARGLENTIGKTPGAKPLIDLKLVEKVTVFDASYQDLGDALRAQQKGLTGLADPKKSGQFASGAVQLYDVTVPNVSKLSGTALDVVAIRGLSYARLVEEGIARGEINLGTLAITSAAVVAATKRILAALPARGHFTTKKPAASGMTNLQDFTAANKADLTTIQDPNKGLKVVIRANDLDWGAKFTPEIDAHHWFVAELAHEAVE